jgi:hypothetical protein
VPADKRSSQLLLDKYGLKAVIPLDMALGIDRLPFKVSPQMMLDIARRAINAASYEELQKTYAQDWNILISDDQIRHITNYIGQLVYENDCSCREAALRHLHEKEDSSGPGKAVSEDILYVEMDGAMFNTRKQENNSTWKENKLGLVFSSRDLRTYQTKEGKQAKRIGKREYISYAGSADIFLEFLYSTALKNGLESHGKVVIISDGARWIKNFKEQYCKGLDVVHILDYSHTKENVYKFANASIRGKKAKRAWAEKLCDLIYNGKIRDALAMTEPYKNMKRPGIPNIHTYLSNNIDCIDYPSYISAGYFIGSGAIESGNKSTMQERLKLPGMRWDITSAQFVLSAKMKYDSGLWNSEVVPLLYQKLGLSLPQ